MPKKVTSDEFLKNLKRSNSVTRQVTFIGQKLVKNAKLEKLKCDILSNFQTLCYLPATILAQRFFFFSPFLINSEAVSDTKLTEDLADLVDLIDLLDLTLPSRFTDSVLASCIIKP